MLEIRNEEPGDINALDRVHHAAFRRNAEGDLVRALRDDNALRISLVATVSEQPVGHIAFSPVTPAINAAEAEPLALGPVGVDPEHERRGIASRLVQAGLDAAVARKAPYVVVLGDPAFYGRFGFQPAADHSLSGEFEGGDAFRIFVPEGGRAPDPGSLIRYHPDFQNL